MAANKEGRLRTAVNLLNELNDGSEKVKMEALKKLRIDHMAELPEHGRPDPRQSPTAELSQKHIKEIGKKLGDSSASVCIEVASYAGDKKILRSISSIWKRNTSIPGTRLWTPP